MVVMDQSASKLKLRSALCCVPIAIGKSIGHYVMPCKQICLNAAGPRNAAPAALRCRRRSRIAGICAVTVGCRFRVIMRQPSKFYGSDGAVTRQRGPVGRALRKKPPLLRGRVVTYTIFHPPLYFRADNYLSISECRTLIRESTLLTNNAPYTQLQLPSEDDEDSHLHDWLNLQPIGLLSAR